MSVATMNIDQNLRRVIFLNYHLNCNQTEFSYHYSYTPMYKTRPMWDIYCYHHSLQSFCCHLRLTRLHLRVNWHSLLMYCYPWWSSLYYSPNYTTAHIFMISSVHIEWRLMNKVFSEFINSAWVYKKIEILCIFFKNQVKTKTRISMLLLRYPSFSRNNAMPHVISIIHELLLKCPQHVPVANGMKE